MTPGKTLAPVSADPDGGAEGREQLAAGAGPLGALGRPAGDRPAGERLVVDVEVEQAAVGVDGDQVAVLDPRQRTAERGLRRHVDGGRDLAGRAGHPAVGDDRDLLAAVLEHAERRGELVQLGHPVGGRALVADHRDEVAAVERALGEGREEVVLVVEDDRRRGHQPVLGLDRRGLDDRAAQRAGEHPQAAVGRERVASPGAAPRGRASPSAPPPTSGRRRAAPAPACSATARGRRRSARRRGAGPTRAACARGRRCRRRRGSGSRPPRRWGTSG